MPLTLEQSRVLARHAESGIGPEDIRFKVRINEAAMRLHAEGDFIGTVARYAVTVSNGEFTIPTVLESIRRVSAIVDGTSHSTAGTLISDDVSAFVMNTASILPVQQIAPRKFKILGAIPSAVEVLGKKKFIFAENESDPLAIDDLYALKIMLISAFREENNDVEQSIALQEQAFSYMSSKTQKAIANARGIQYGNMAVNERVNTMGWARAKLALSISKGVHMDDLLLVDLLNNAESRLITMTRPYVTSFFKVVGGVLSLPNEIESLLKVSVEGCPLTIRSQWFEFDENGYGFRENDTSNTLSGAMYRGEFPTLQDIGDPSQILVASNKQENKLSIVIRGKNTGGFDIEETVLLNGVAQAATTINSFSSISAITKTVSHGELSLSKSGSSVLLARLKQNDLEARYSRYILPDMKDGQEQIVRVVARPRFIPKHSDSDEMQIKNIDALVQMAQGILAERETLTSQNAEATLIVSKSMANAAITTQDQYALGKQVGHAKKMNFPRALGLGSINRIY